VLTYRMQQGEMFELIQHTTVLFSSHWPLTDINDDPHSSGNRAGAWQYGCLCCCTRARQNCVRGAESQVQLPRRREWDETHGERCVWQETTSVA